MKIKSLSLPYLLGVAGAAIVMAYISANYLFHGNVLNTIAWGILAFLTAFLASSRREAWEFGGLFGFVVSYAFLWFDNTNQKTLHTVLILIPLIILPACFGLLCGLLLTTAGWYARRLVLKGRYDSD
jgi:hypothetical protein